MLRNELGVPLRSMSSFQGTVNEQIGRGTFRVQGLDPRVSLAAVFARPASPDASGSASPWAWHIERLVAYVPLESPSDASVQAGSAPPAPPQTGETAGHGEDHEEEGAAAARAWFGRMGLAYTPVQVVPSVDRDVTELADVPRRPRRKR